MNTHEPQHMRKTPKPTKNRIEANLQTPDSASEFDWSIPYHIAHPFMARLLALIGIFAIGSLFGWIYESIFDIIQGHDTVTRATFILPWCPIYGIGCAILELLVGKGFDTRPTPSSRIVSWFFSSAIISAGCELLASYILEMNTGSFPWNYSAYPLNFEGRIAIPFIVIFAAIATIMLAFINPFIHRKINEDPANAGSFAVMIILLLIIEMIVQYIGKADEVRYFMVHNLDKLVI